MKPGDIKGTLMRPRGHGKISARVDGVTSKQMVRDYETPTVPRPWESFAQNWANRLGLSRVPVLMSCSPDRYGNPVVLKVVRLDGVECIFTRRGSDADDAADRRIRFIDAVRHQDIRAVELDVAGYFVGEGAIDCALCPGAAGHEEWQHAIVRELLRVAQPFGEPHGPLSPDEADDVERADLDRRVAELLETS